MRISQQPKANPRIAVPGSDPNQDYYTVSLADAATEISGGNPGSFYSGVAQVRLDNDTLGSGVLLPTGRHILTAAHVVRTEEGESYPASGVHVGFPEQDELRDVREVLFHEEYDPDNFANDIGLIELEGSAPEESRGYELYQGGEEVGSDFVLAGYGLGGTGTSGTIPDSGHGLRLGQNEYNAAGDYVNLETAWSYGERTLVFDFDNGSQDRDASDYYLDRPELGLGEDEVNATPGDSGGPSFIEGKIAGVHSFSLGNIATDATSEVDGSFGEFSFDTRVSSYTDWIEANIPDPEFQFQDRFAVREGDGESNELEISVSLSEPPVNDVSVDYRTVEGSAEPNRDYDSLQGSLHFEPGQTQESFAVTVFGNQALDLNRTFSVLLESPEGALLQDPGLQVEIRDDDYSGCAVFSGRVPEESSFSDVIFSNDEGLWVKLYDPLVRDYYVDPGVSQEQQWIRFRDLDEMDLPSDRRFFVNTWDSDQGLGQWQDFRYGFGNSPTGIWSSGRELEAGEEVPLADLLESQGLEGGDWIKLYDPLSHQDSGYFQGSDNGGYIDSATQGWIRIRDLEEEIWVAGSEAGKEKIWYRAWAEDIPDLGWEDLALRTLESASDTGELSLTGVPGQDLAADSNTTAV